MNQSYCLFVVVALATESFVVVALATESFVVVALATESLVCSSRFSD
jgi:hypothetical protein